MKITKILLILTVVCLSFQRVLKKSKTGNISASVSCGKDCGVKNSYSITIGRDSQSSSNKVAQCTFRVDKISTLDTEGHIGLPFDNCSGTDTTKFTNVFYKFASGTYILEYRLISDSISATNPSSNPMYFYFNVNVSGKTYTYYFVFEYNYWSSVIDFDTDLNNTLLNKIRTAVKTQKSAITTKKTNISTEAATYQTNKSLNDASTTSSLDYASQITAQQTLVTTKTAERTALQTTATTTSASIVTKQSEIDTLKAQKLAQDATATQSATAIVKSNGDVAALQEQKTSGKANTSTFQTAVDNAKSILDADFAWFAADADFNQTEITAAKTAIYTTISYSAFSTAWAVVLPVVA
jgi:hypothetical protein